MWIWQQGEIIMNEPNHEYNFYSVLDQPQKTQTWREIFEDLFFISLFRSIFGKDTRTIWEKRADAMMSERYGESAEIIYSPEDEKFMREFTQYLDEKEAEARLKNKN